MWQVFKFTILFSPHDHFMVSYYYSHFTDRETKARETELSKVTWASKWQHQDSNFVWQNPATVLLHTVLHYPPHRTWRSTLTSNLTLWSWRHYKTSVNLSFLICKMEETFLVSSRCWENHMGKHLYNTTSTTGDPQKVLDKYFPSLPLPHRYQDGWSTSPEMCST